MQQSLIMDLLDAVARNGTSAVEDSVQYIKVMHFAVKHTDSEHEHQYICNNENFTFVNDRSDKGITDELYQVMR